MNSENKLYYLYFKNGQICTAPEKLIKEIISMMTVVPRLKNYKKKNTLKKGYEILNIGFQEKLNVTEFIVWGEDLSAIESCVELGLIPSLDEITRYLNDETDPHAIAIQETRVRLSQNLSPLILEYSF